MAIALTEIVFSTPLGAYEIYSNAVASPLEPWKGWDDTHFNFSKVITYSAPFWRQDPSLVIPLELSRWVLPLCAFAFFAFFGFAEEARRNYRMAAMVVVKRIPCLRRIHEKRTVQSKYVLLPVSPLSLC